MGHCGLKEHVLLTDHVKEHIYCENKENTIMGLEFYE